MANNQSKTDGESLQFLFDEAELNKDHDEAATKSGAETPQPSTDNSDAQFVKLSKTSTKPIDIPNKKEEFVPEYPSGRPHTIDRHGNK